MEINYFTLFCILFYASYFCILFYAILRLSLRSPIGKQKSRKSFNDKFMFPNPHCVSIFQIVKCNKMVWFIGLRFRLPISGDSRSLNTANRLVILNHGRMTRSTPEMAPSSPQPRLNQRKDFGPYEINVHMPRMHGRGNYN